MEENVLSNLVDTLIETGRQVAESRQTIEVKDLHDDGESVRKIVRTDTEFQILELRKTPVPMKYKFNSVESLLAYLNSDSAEAGGVVLVNGSKSEADLAVGKHVAHTAVMAHLHAPELKYLLDLREPVTQLKMRIAMRDLLKEYIENADVLAAQLSGLKIRKTSDRGCKISAMNLVTVSGIDSTVMTIDTPDGEQEVTLGYNWKYTGRVFACTDKQYSFQTVLSSVERENEIRFTIAIPTLQDVLNTAVRDLAELIRAGITNDKIAVYEGE